LVCSNSHSWTTLKLSMKEWSFWNWITLSGWRCLTVDARSWISVVGMVTRIWIGWSGVWILVGPRDFSLLQNVQTESTHHPVPRVLWFFHADSSWSMNSHPCWAEA
jgi:hypothetical protein